MKKLAIVGALVALFSDLAGAAPVCDAIQMGGAPTTISLGSPNLAIAGAAFVAADVGKVIGVPGAAPLGQSLNASIVAVTSPTTVVLSKNAGFGIAGAARLISYGTDDTGALQALLDDPATRSVDLTNLNSCMTTVSLATGVGTTRAKDIFGSPRLTKIIFRQISGMYAGHAFWFKSAAPQSSLRKIMIDYDAGPITGSGQIILADSTVEIDGVDIEGNAPLSSPNITAIDASSNPNNVIKNSTVNGVTGHGISVNNATLATVDNNYVTMPANGLYGIVSQNIGSYPPMIDVKITNNKVFVKAQPKSGVNVGILVRGDPAKPTYWPTVTGNKVYGTNGATVSGNGSIAGIYVNGGNFSYNYVQDGGIGMSVGGGGYGNITSHNNVVSPTFYGIEIGGSSNVIDANIIDGGNILWQGIALQGDFGQSVATISSNIIQNCSVPYFNSGAITNVVKTGNFPTI